MQRLEDNEYEVFVLGQQTSQGTIIQKFDHYAKRAQYAVVLLVDDDRGLKEGRPSEPPTSARQNVIFELGFSRAALGPS